MRMILIYVTKKGNINGGQSGAENLRCNLDRTAHLRCKNNTMYKGYYGQ